VAEAAAVTGNVFVSYANEDREVAGALVAALKERGWPVWWDREIPAGTQYETYIKSKLDEAACVVVLWSKHSVASRWVRGEADAVADRGRLVPARIDSCEIPVGFRAIQTADLSDWDGSTTDAELVTLLNGVARALRRTSQAVDAPPTPHPPRWWVPIVWLCVPLSGAVILSYVRVAVADIALDLRSSEVGFTLRSLQALTSDPWPLDTLGASGLREVVLPRSRRHAESEIRLAAVRSGDHKGTINLDVTPLPPAARVRFGHLAGTSPRDYRLSIERAPVGLNVSVDGPVAVVIPGALNEQERFALDRVALRTDSSAVNLDLTQLSGASPPAFPELDAESLSFHRIDKVREAGQTADPVSSTIVSGTMSWPGLRRPGATFATGADLWLHGAKGRLSIGDLSGGLIGVRFEGTTRGIRGAAQAMPSLLEELLTRHRAMLVSLAVLYVIALAVVLVRRRRRFT